MKSKSLAFAAILTFALIVRFAALFEFGVSEIRFGDAPDYLAAAKTFCSTGSYPDQSSMPSFARPACRSSSLPKRSVTLT